MREFCRSRVDENDRSHGKVDVTAFDDERHWTEKGKAAEQIASEHERRERAEQLRVAKLDEEERRAEYIEKNIRNVVEVGPGNYYGCLCVGVLDGKCYWSVGNYDAMNWQEIRPSLYKELMK